MTAPPTKGDEGTGLSEARICPEGPDHRAERLGQKLPDGSAEIGLDNPLAENAAGDLKQVPKGYVPEIAGDTDNTGDAAINLELSQRCAGAVRDALIKAGADPDMSPAKGDGSADPIASNDMPEGRRRNAASSTMS